MLVSAGLTWILGNFSLVSTRFGWFRRWGFPGFPGLKSLGQWLPEAGGKSSDFAAIDIHHLAFNISIYMLYVNI
jgi:hypothetical protein